MTRNRPLAQKAVTSNGAKEEGLQLALAASELRYRRLFETAQDGILILNGENGRVVDVNPFLLELLNYPVESIIGRELWEIGLFKDIAANQAAVEQLQKDNYIRYENLPLCTRNGRSIQVEFVSNVYFTGSERVIQCKIRDISTRAAVQNAADARVAALEVAGRTKDEVIAVLSHELRTPVAAITSMIDLVELGHAAVSRMPGAPDVHRFDASALALIRRNVQTLSRLLNELLDLTRIAKGGVPLALESVDAHEAIAFVLKNLESMQKTNEIEIEVRLLAQHRLILADSVKLGQVLMNLIGNAVKFTAQGGRVTILTRNEGGSRFVLEVSDTGIGIPPEALPRIFEPFEQGDSSIHSRYGGLGLGLSIARALTLAHGGTLEAESQGLNRGATFTARFNLEAPADEVVQPAGVASSDSLRILLVEDQEDLRECMTDLLVGHGYTVSAASDTKSAMALSSLYVFDLLLTDVELPDGNGLQLLNQMKEHLPDLQGIAITGYGMPSNVRDTLAAGFSAHLEKPVEYPILRAAIERLSPSARAASQTRLRA